MGKTKPLAQRDTEVSREAILDRITMARGRLMMKKRRDIVWAEIGRAFDWGPAVTHAVSSGERDIRLWEIYKIGKLLETRAAWLAFGDGEPELDREPVASSERP
jgi:hypothetical protein